MTTPKNASRPAGAALLVATVVVVLVAPLWLWTDPLDGYSPRAEGIAGLGPRLARLADPFGGTLLQLDDFEYVAESRTPTDLSRNLWTTHNTHLVPLFRVWTFLWVRLAGNLERLPETLGMAGYLTYMLALVLVAHVVAYESHSPALGVGVMAAVGVSAVLEPTVRWFSAGQALAAGAACLATIGALQYWRARGGWWWLVGGALAAAVAPLLWSGGYVAGPAGFVYLWCDGRPAARRAALVPLVASAVVAVFAAAVAGRAITSQDNFHERTVAQAVNPVQGAVSTAQGVVEVLVMRNLGLASETSPAQGVALALGLAAVWAWTRGRPWRPNPLEAAGLVMVLLGFFLVYTARGYFTFESLRDLSWYQAIPQLGAALFVGGWLQGRHDPARLPMRAAVWPTRRGILAALGVVAVALTLQTARVRARVEATAPPMAASEPARFPTPALRRMRARYLSSEQIARQERFLARLDRLNALAAHEGLDRSTLKRLLGRVLGPGMPAHVPAVDALNLISLPEKLSQTFRPNAAAIASFQNILEPETQPRPPWLDASDRWPAEIVR